MVRSGLENGPFEKGVFSEKVHFLEILDRDSRVLREPSDFRNKGDCDHFLETLENLEILEILEMSEKTPFVMTPFPVPIKSPNFPWIFPHFQGEGFWDPQIAFLPWAPETH